MSEASSQSLLPHASPPSASRQVLKLLDMGISHRTHDRRPCDRCATSRSAWTRESSWPAGQPRFASAAMPGKRRSPRQTTMCLSMPEPNTPARSRGRAQPAVRRPRQRIERSLHRHPNCVHRQTRRAGRRRSAIACLTLAVTTAYARPNDAPHALLAIIELPEPAIECPRARWR